MIKNEIRNEISNRSTGIGKIFVDTLFGVWTLIGSLLFVWIIDTFMGDDNKDH